MSLFLSVYSSGFAGSSYPVWSSIFVSIAMASSHPLAHSQLRPTHFILFLRHVDGYRPMMKSGQDGPS